MAQLARIHFNRNGRCRRKSVRLLFARIRHCETESVSLVEPSRLPGASTRGANQSSVFDNSAVDGYACVLQILILKRDRAAVEAASRVIALRQGRCKAARSGFFTGRPCPKAAYDLHAGRLQSREAVSPCGRPRARANLRLRAKI